MSKLEELDSYRIQQKTSLEAGFTRALRAFFPKLKTDDIKADFFAVYQKEAEAFDKEFTKKYDEDLNTTLIFVLSKLHLSLSSVTEDLRQAGLFSAVTSAFVIDVQTNLQPDYTQETTILLRILIHKTDSTFPNPDLSSLEWTGPDPELVAVQSLLYASLAASLLAAFLAVLGKQWLNRYARAKGGSAVERCRDRQRKADGMSKWYFPVVMEGLPLMLQAALLLLGCALSRYIWTIDHTVALILITVTSFGVVIYLLLVVLASSSYDCPYQTPFSLGFHHMMKFDAEYTRYIPRFLERLRSARNQVESIWHASKLRSSLSRIRDKDVDVVVELGVVPNTKDDDVYVQRDDLPAAELQEHSLNASCVSWIVENSTDPDVTLVAIRCIPEIEWRDADATALSIQRLGVVLDGCIHAGTSKLPGSQDLTSAAFKAHLHLRIQAEVWQSETAVNSEVSTDLLIFAECLSLSDEPYSQTAHSLLRRYRWDIPLTDQQIFSSITYDSLPLVEMPWIFRNLLRHTWSCKRAGRPHSPHLYGFLKSCLQRQHVLPKAVFIDCLLILGLTLGMPPHVEYSLEKEIVSFDVYKVLKRVYLFAFPHLARMIQIGSGDSAVQALQLLHDCSQNLSHYHQLRTVPPIGRAIISLLRHLLHVLVTSGRWPAVHLLLQLESSREPHVLDHSTEAYEHGDDVLTYVEYLLTLQTGVDNWLFNGLLALGRSNIGDKSELWGARIMKCLCKALGRDNSEKMREMVFATLQSRSLDLKDAFAAFEISRHLNPTKISILQMISLHLPQSYVQAYGSWEWKVYTDIICELAARPLCYSLMIRDHWKMAEFFLTKPAGFSQGLREARYMMRPVINSPEFVTIVKDSNDRDVIAAWLAYALSEYDQLKPGSFARIVEAITDLFTNAEDTTIITFERLPTAWLDRRTQGQDDSKFGKRFIDLVETYLKIAWKRPSTLEPRVLDRYSEATSELYRRKGYAAMDDEILQPWLKATWTKPEMKLVGAVKEATLEVFRRGGAVVYEEYGLLMDSIEHELEKSVSYTRFVELVDVQTGSSLHTKREAELLHSLRDVRSKRQVLAAVYKRSTRGTPPEGSTGRSSVQGQR